MTLRWRTPSQEENGGAAIQCYKVSLYTEGHFKHHSCFPRSRLYERNGYTHLIGYRVRYYGWAIIELKAVNKLGDGFTSTINVTFIQDVDNASYTGNV